MKKLVALALVLGMMISQHEFCLRLSRGLSEAYMLGWMSGSMAECKELGLELGGDVGELAVLWCLVGVGARRKGVVPDRGRVQDEIYDACMRGWRDD